MNFYCDYMTRSPGVFAQFNTWQEFLDWVAQTFEDVDPRSSVWYRTERGRPEKNSWVMVEDMGRRFILCPYYYVRGEHDVGKTVTFTGPATYKLPKCVVQ